jgi:hypothetical protein
MTEANTVDMTPTWEELLPLLVHRAVKGTPSSTREAAMGELLRIARAVDALNKKARDVQPIDVAVPDVPEREMTGAYRLRNLKALVADVQLMMSVVNATMTPLQMFCVERALESLLFGEQA